MDDQDQNPNGGMQMLAIVILYSATCVAIFAVYLWQVFK